MANTSYAAGGRIAEISDILDSYCASLNIDKSISAKAKEIIEVIKSKDIDFLENTMHHVNNIAGGALCAAELILLDGKNKNCYIIDILAMNYGLCRKAIFNRSNDMLSIYGTERINNIAELVHIYLDSISNGSGTSLVNNDADMIIEKIKENRIVYLLSGLHIDRAISSGVIAAAYKKNNIILDINKLKDVSEICETGINSKCEEILEIIKNR